MGPLDLLNPEPAPLFGGPPARNAYVELHNLIAAAAGPSEFGPSDRERISARHGVDLATSFLAERSALYGALLDERLAAGHLRRSDRALLDHVADTLALSGAERRPAHERAFARAVEAAIADDALSDDDRRLLYTLQHTLGFDPRVTDGVYGVFARRRLLAVVAHALADGEVSPDEADEIGRVCEALSVEVPDDVAGRIARASARWQMRNGTLPVVRDEVDLAPGEVAHLQTSSARWRAVDGERLYGASERHETALQTGRTSGLRVPAPTLVGPTRTGGVVITNQRVVLRPARGLPVDVPLRRLAAAFLFANGVVVRTRGGQWTLFDLDGDEETAYAILLRVLRPIQPGTVDGGGAETRSARSFQATARWRDVDLDALMDLGDVYSSALREGRTERLRIAGDVLSPRGVRGSVSVVGRSLVLRWAGRTEEVPLTAADPPRRFANGVLVRVDGAPSLLVDAGDRTKDLVAALEAALAEGGSAPEVAASGVRWRRVLVQEVHWAWAEQGRGDDRPFWQRVWSPSAPLNLTETVRVLDARDAAWDGPGRATVTYSHLVFDDDRSVTRRTTLETIREAVTAGRVLWLRRDHAHDWLVRFATDADADRVRRALVAGGVGEG